MIDNRATPAVDRDAPPGRDAADGGEFPREGRRARHRPKDEPQSYYGLPVLNRPVWAARDIAGYLFLGGMAGASSVLGAGAAVTGRSTLHRAATVTAAGSIGLSLAALIHDLGRPTRFVNMLRVVKVTSPMSVGSWLLAVYAPVSFGAAGASITGRAPRLGWAASLVAAGLGPVVASYTGALIADTAVPAWHDGHREMPLLFAASGAAAGGGMALLWSPTVEAAPARRMAVAGAVAEATLATLMEQRMGFAGEPYRVGKAGRLLQLAKGCAIAGAAGALAGRGSRAVSAVAGTALVVGSALTRFGVFEAGLQSADDPRYVVAPQRERLRERTA